MRGAYTYCGRADGYVVVPGVTFVFSHAEAVITGVAPVYNFTSATPAHGLSPKKEWLKVAT